MRDYGETRRGWLGVHIQSVTDEIAESLGMDRAKGALVANVTADGPAQSGGVQAGDVIIEFDGKPVNKMRQLPRLVAETQVGKDVPVTVWRRGEEVGLTVTLGRLEAQDAQALAENPSGNAEEATIAEFGVSLSALTDEIREQFSIQDSTDGVAITEVEPEGNAAAKELQVGDVIVEVNQDSVATPGDVAEIVAGVVQAGRKSVLLLINRAGERRFVVVSVL